MNKDAYISIILLILLIIVSLFSTYYFNKVNNGLSLFYYYKLGKKELLEQKFEYEKIIYDKKLLESLFGEYIKKNIYTLEGESRKNYEGLRIVLKLQRIIEEDYRMYAYILASNKNNSYILEANGYVVNRIFENEEFDRNKLYQYIDEIMNNAENLKIKFLSKELMSLNDLIGDKVPKLKGIYYLDKLDYLSKNNNKEMNKIDLEGILVVDEKSDFTESNTIINLEGLLLSKGEYPSDYICYKYDRYKSYKYGRKLPKFIDFNMETIKVY